MSERIYNRFGNVDITCPSCEENITVHCFEDPSVGITFEVDDIVSGDCNCDWDDETIYKRIADAAYPKYMEQKYGTGDDIEFETRRKECGVDINYLFSGGDFS